MTSSALNRREEAASADADTPKWMALAGANTTGGKNYAPRIEGEIPRTLSGDLFRNGPGMFERNGVVKRRLLDGDGIVQRLSFRDGVVRYRNAFVQTDKFREEEEAGKFLYSTWSAQRPGGLFKNLGGGPMVSQAGVTVYPVGGRVLAFDETNPAYEVDSETLATVGPRTIGDPAKQVSIKAHAKFDPLRKQWLFAGQSFGRKFDLHAIIHAEDGTHISTRTVEDVRQVYIHDFLATPRYFVFVMHPCEVHPLAFLAGTKSFIESMKWNAAKGNEIILVPRDGGEVKRFEAPAAFMWHGLNAFEAGDEIIADFVGYDEPDHFVGEDPFLGALMKGHLGEGKYPGTIRRYRINVTRGTLAQEIVAGGNHEFPMIDGRVALQRHRIGYFAQGGKPVFQSGLKRLDYDTGASQNYDFGAEAFVGEPVFAERPGGAVDEGWLLSQVLDGVSGKTFFAILDAQRVDAGPVAKVWLDHAMPISFHGSWRAA